MSDRSRLRQLRRHRIPAWWSDAKLGIFVHWTPASVPAFAPTHTGIGELLASGRPDALAETPYTEWYQNSLRFPASSTARHHREVHGDRPYSSFVDEFDEGLEHWDPGSWAASFRDAGARYVVLVAKHHDGVCLWPTDVAHPLGRGRRLRRDVVGELAEAVRSVGLRFGVYYSGGLDWTFDDRPLGSVADVAAALPRDPYPDYAEAQVRELVARYRPSVLWNDITWPTTAGRLWRLFEDYYDAVPDGVVNDRWLPWSQAFELLRLRAARRLLAVAATRNARSERGLVPPRPPHFDVRTPEYVAFDTVQRDPWECVRGIDSSFGYNAASSPEDFLTHGGLIGTCTGIVAAGGNLLLNVGPRGVDGSIPDEQLDRLAWLGEWAAGSGASMFASRPWIRSGVVMPDGTRARFWARGRAVWAVLDRDPSGAGTTDTVLPGVRPTPTTTVVDVTGDRSSGVVLDWSGDPGGLRLGLGRPVGPPSAPTVVEMTDVVAAPIPDQERT